jgi:hypothetical protein
MSGPLRIVGDPAADPLTIYLCNCADWEAELSAALGLGADVEWYDEVGAPLVYSFCTNRHVVLWKRP